ncbi:MAG: ATP-binding protein [Pseudomonadota bacterium]
MVDKAANPHDTQGRGKGGRIKRFLRPVTERLERVLRKALPRQLFARSLIIVVAPMILAQIVTSYVFMERHYQLVTRRLSSAVAQEMALLVRTVEALKEPEKAAYIRRAEFYLGFDITIVPGASIPTLTTPWYSVADRTIRTEFDKQLDRPFWFNTRARDSWVEFRTAIPEGVLRVEVRRSRVLATNWHIFLVWMTAGSLVFLFVAVLFLRNQIRPIQRLAVAAEGFGKGGRVGDFKPAGAMEVRRAAEAFLDMKERIERHISQRTEMLAGVSHDLRTPLTRMKLELAMLPTTAEVEALRSDVAEMERMLEDYLSFARGQTEERIERMDLTTLLDEVAANFARKGKSVVNKTIGDFSARTRPNAVRRVLNNLVENATTYAEHTELTIKREGDDSLTLIVDDDGPGIPEERREEAFRPFHRLDHARDPDHVGTGLGLAVARDLARAMGGDLSLGGSYLGGLQARFVLPT